MATAESVKAQLTALLAQANDTTGKTDANLTAAIASLISGFGQGSSSGMFETGEFIGDGVVHNDLNPIQIPLSFEPDFILICLTDLSTAFDKIHLADGLLIRDTMYHAGHRTADSTALANSGYGLWIDGLYGSNANKATYQDGVLNWILNPSNRVLYSGAPYTWIARKW